MKFILKDGTEYDLESMQYHKKLTNSDTSGYNFQLEVTSTPKELVDSVTAALTTDNISDITIIDNETKVFNFAFTEVLEIGLQILVGRSVLSVILS